LRIGKIARPVDRDGLRVSEEVDERESDRLSSCLKSEKDRGEVDVFLKTDGECVSFRIVSPVGKGGKRQTLPRSERDRGVVDCFFFLCSDGI